VYSAVLCLDAQRAFCLQRGLSAIAELLVNLVITSMVFWCRTSVLMWLQCWMTRRAPCSLDHTSINIAALDLLWV